MPEESSSGRSPEQSLLERIFGETVISVRSDQHVQLAHIEMASQPTLGEVVDFLNSLRCAYAAIDSFLTATVPSTYYSSQRFAESWFQEGRQPTQDLVLYRGLFQSPGFWEVLGNLNPLKVICDYLQQRHERRKDDEYRNRAEEQRLALENAILQNEVVQKRVTILREIGVPDEEIRAILTKHVASPLEQLGRGVDQKLIGKARVVSRRRKKSV